MTVFYIKTIDGKEFKYIHVNLEVQAMMWNGEIPLMKIKLVTPVMGIWHHMTVFYIKTIDGKVFKSIHVNSIAQFTMWNGEIPLMEIKLMTPVMGI